jgi:hypothetical protein
MVNYRERKILLLHPVTEQRTGWWSLTAHVNDSIQEVDLLQVVLLQDIGVQIPATSAVAECGR